MHFRDCQLKTHFLFGSTTASYNFASCLLFRVCFPAYAIPWDVGKVEVMSLHRWLVHQEPEADHRSTPLRLLLVATDLTLAGWRTRRVWSHWAMLSRLHPCHQWLTNLHLPISPPIQTPLAPLPPSLLNPSPPAYLAMRPHIPLDHTNHRSNINTLVINPWIYLMVMARCP